MAESTIFSIKAKLSQNIRSRDKTTHENEVLIKVLLHNIVTLRMLKFYRPNEIDFTPLGEIPVFHQPVLEDEDTEFTPSSKNTKKSRRGVLSRLDNKVRCSYCYSSVTASKDGKIFWPVAGPLTCYNCYERKY